MFYDGMLLFAWLMAAAAPVVMAAGGADSGLVSGVWFQADLYAAAYLFFGWFWTHGGQTLGLRCWKLRVIGQDGGDLNWGDAAIRFLAATLSLCAFGLGFAAALFHPQRLAWHDRLSKSRVARARS